MNSATKNDTAILVIEDEGAVRFLFDKYLSDIGYRVLLAASGKEGLFVYEQEQPDIVLLDLRMPGMDGLEVLEALEDRAKETPVIIVSGAADFEDAIEAIRLGAWDFLTKPITDMRVLSLSIDRALDRSRLLMENKRYSEHLEDLIEARTIELKTELSLRQQAEKSLKSSLKEKEALLKEIHHRVKNNLQVISSLLNLQSEYIQDNSVLELFRESQNRVKSMALVHEKIYQSNDLARINFADYIVNITNHLFNSYRPLSDGIKLISEMDETACLKVDKAVPCGILIN